MEDFEWGDEETELKYRLFQKMLNRTIKDKFEFIKGVSVDPVSFQKAYLSFSYFKRYDITIAIYKSLISNYSEESIDKFEEQFNEIFDTLIKTIAPPKNKNDFKITVSSELELI